MEIRKIKFSNGRKFVYIPKESDLQPGELVLIQRIPPIQLNVMTGNPTTTSEKPATTLQHESV